MIHSITCDLPSFKSLSFKPGLNILLANKVKGASAKDTLNGSGKTSIIEIIHFLLGAKGDQKTLFQQPRIKEALFSMDLDLKERATVSRSAGSTKTSVGDRAYSLEEWTRYLGATWFGLDAGSSYAPSFRSILSYFIRRQNNNAFNQHEKHFPMQQEVDFQVNLMFLLDLDWRIAAEWQKVRNGEKTLKELRAAMKDEKLGNILGDVAELRSQITVKEKKAQDLKNQIAAFKVHPQYQELREEADQLTAALRDHSNQLTLDQARLRDLNEALSQEMPPPSLDVERLYREAGVVLPDLVTRRYEEVRAFHESVIRNRRHYLESEQRRTQESVARTAQHLQSTEQRRGEVLRILESHGALEQFTEFQAELGRREGELALLRQKHELTSKLESAKYELTLERGNLMLRLARDMEERHHQVDQAILTYEAISKQLYVKPGTFKIITDNKNGPKFEFTKQGNNSKGIRNMEIFCFDLMLTQLCAQRGIGPGVLVHDSHLFDGVDGRQLISALLVGAETAAEQGFQYIVTLNEDDAKKEVSSSKDIEPYLLPVQLTDEREDGGLFGFRF